MSYVNIKENEFINYFEKWFSSDMYSFVCQYLNGGGRISHERNDYLVKEYINNNFLLFYSQKMGELKTTDINMCMFVSAFFYIYTFIFILEQYSSYHWDDNELWNSCDYVHNFAVNYNLPVFYLTVDSIMFPITMMKSFGFFHTGKQTKQSMIETILKTKTYIIKKIKEEYISKLGLNKHNNPILFQFEKIIEIYINELTYGKH